MTPRERVSDERLAELLAAEIGPSADDAVLLALDLSDVRRERDGLRRTLDEALNSGDGSYRP